MINSRTEAFDIIITIFFAFLCFLTLYPFIYAFSYSISDSIEAAKSPVLFLPKGFTLQNYQIMFMDSKILMGLFISILRTASGTILFIMVTASCAYSMSKKRLAGRKLLFLFYVIPMYVNGGMIPTYILIRNLGLFNNFLVYILPVCFSGFFMFLMKVYFESIPDSLEESAKLDGANDFIIAIKIYAPLSIPVIVTVGLFIGVNQWNSWFDALLYVADKSIHPLQLILQEILRQTQIRNILDLFEMSSGQKPRVNSETYKMAVLIITTAPIVFLYPFAQKYFIKGMTIGAVKM